MLPEIEQNTLNTPLNILIDIIERIQNEDIRSTLKIWIKTYVKIYEKQLSVCKQELEQMQFEKKIYYEIREKQIAHEFAKSMFDDCVIKIPYHGVFPYGNDITIYKMFVISTGN